MAIAFDNSGQATAGAVSSKTFAYTVNTNTNGIIFVGMTGVDSNHNAISSVTYGGNALTALVNQVNSPAGLGNRFFWLGYLLIPPTGSNNVVITWAGTLSQDASITVASYTGVKQSTPTDGSNTDFSGASTTSYVLTATTTAANDWMIALALHYNNNSATVTAGASTTIRQTAIGNAGNDIAIFYDSNATRTAGSNSLTLTPSVSDPFSGAIYGIQPSTGIAYTQTCTEAILNTDSITTFHGKVSNLTESITNTATFLYVFTRTLTESITNSDTFTNLKTKLGLFFESITNIDTKSLKINGSDVLWSHLNRSAAAVYSHITRNVAAWTHITKN